ncbi:GTP-binding protein [Spirillospora sp. NPDC052242]
MKEHVIPIGNRSPAEPPQTLALKQVVRRLLSLDDDTGVVVRQLACTEPGCPPLETVDEVVSRVRAINAPVEIIPARHAEIDLHRVLDVGAFDLERVLKDDPAFLTETEHQHDTTVTSVGIDVPGELDEERLDRWLGDLLRTKGADIFRSKGILAIAGEARQYVFQGVHMLLDGEFGRAWADGEARHNRLVFIGRDLDRDALERAFADCLVDTGKAA